VVRLAAAIGVLGIASLVLRGERPARACSGGYYDWVDPYSVFDPDVLGDPALAPVYYDRDVSRYGGYNPGFGEDALVADWHGYLAGAASDADWRKVLFATTAADVEALQRRIAGKPGALPKGFEHSSLGAQPAARPRLAAALAVVKLAHDVEPSAMFASAWDPTPGPSPPPALLAAATAGLTATAADPFLTQRYAFQAVRVLFYQRDWPKLVQFFDQHAAVLAGPSPGLAWRARYYLAGALGKSGDHVRGDLELAHVHAHYAPLAGAAAGDFHPGNDVDWSAALAAARTVRDKTELWRIAGVRFDGIGAAREILRLDPKSDLIGLLVVRELARAESLAEASFQGDSDNAAGNHALADIEKLVLQLAATPGVDRPWLASLAAGHLAARRGDLAATRTWIARALAGKPNDARVTGQAQASLSLALVATWKIDAAHERELAQAMRALSVADANQRRTIAEVRERLAKLYLAANRPLDAELLRPGIIDETDRSADPPVAKRRWVTAGFIKQLIAHVDHPVTEFDSFVAIQSSLSSQTLRYELALRDTLDGEFAAASQLFTTAKLSSTRLSVDPFVTHIKDCRVCDEKKYAKAPWTHASVIARLAQLAPVAAGTGESAVDAAIQIGNALFNFTEWGNARDVLRATHQDSSDTAPALRWYQRAYDLTKNKERKAMAAYLAAKAERGSVSSLPSIDDANGELPVPHVWFGKLKTLSDTRYYKDVVRECGTFQRWLSSTP
jgi:tetratricopeptide (TPR) repeat protein